ncbi:hypothetical protein A1O3_03139 [Capronia epimyces CBS 606.96]|uniref:N-acetyltransferase domain-containing protein n=1 Tax=Capronia epimyces CBS 606.96 TaxID=1182542 RepID=W9YLE3_9EURO|nr:uncharacterized protein A1O3_03139 [Capronia epimyces CBS 606.96]EXJ90071.1 hypothetical protein A1O3_03139 [Capronia epimyces CBS 606.96]
MDQKQKLDMANGATGPALPQPAVRFRPAGVEEDDVLSRILCNAFLPIWDHNWFQGVSAPLEPVVVNVNVTVSNNGNGKPSSGSMSRQQKSRVRFYWSLIKLTRLLGGEVLVAEVPAARAAGKTETETEAETDIGAILLWLPPSKRLGALDVGTLWKSGFFSLMLPWNYGLGGLYRIEMVSEANVRSMFARTLKDACGFADRDCGFVRMVASNPKYAGQGYGSKLLQHQIERHFARFAHTPVILDTSTSQAVRAYQRLGFTLLAEVPVDTGTDARGIPLTKSASEEVRRQARETCVERVMVRLP